MWLFLPFGFFSVVADPADVDRVVVRARSQAHLVALLGYVTVKLGYSTLSWPITATPLHDYPYRVVLTRVVLAEVMCAFVGDSLRYGNFKNEAHRVGILPGAALHDVWATMRGVEDAAARVVGSGHAEAHEGRVVRPLRQRPRRR